MENFPKLMDSGKLRQRLNEIRKTLRETEKAIEEIKAHINKLKNDGNGRISRSSLSRRRF
jgi:hypothetical protein